MWQMCCSLLWRAAVCCSVCEREIPEYFAVCCSVLQCVAVCVRERYLNALQCVAGYCVLRCSMYKREIIDMS